MRQMWWQCHSLYIPNFAGHFQLSEVYVTHITAPVYKDIGQQTTNKGTIHQLLPKNFRETICPSLFASSSALCSNIYFSIHKVNLAFSGTGMCGNCLC